jgi:hypothetical protein
MTDPDPVPPAPAGKPKSRAWFVVLAWITIVGFAAFVALITIGVACIPQLRKAKQGRVEIPETRRMDVA